MYTRDFTELSCDAALDLDAGSSLDRPYPGRLCAVLERMDTLLPLSILLQLFWTSFWLLNGLDKFFNSPSFFGVTRDAAFVEYFAGIGLPPTPALASLYLCAVFELLLGLGFAATLALRLPSLVQLCLKGSALVFIIFSAADILFGDRRELWEHATYLVLVLASMVTLQIKPGSLPAATGRTPSQPHSLPTCSGDQRDRYYYR